MKATELRIGNWIASGANHQNIETWVIGKVHSISCLNSQFEQIEVETEEEFTWFFKNNYFGIPLTEEWLVKFGFDQNNVDIEKYECKWYKLSFTLDYWNAQKFFIYGYIGGNKTIKYVNQLQNLYFALMGEELTIKE